MQPRRLVSALCLLVFRDNRMKIVLCFLVAFLVDLGSVEGVALTQTTPTPVNPGTCPVVESMSLGLCGRNCDDDSQCPSNQKCCQTGCDGRQCQAPNDKEGVCPTPTNSTTCKGAITCTMDSKCSGGMKCCPMGCDSMICHNPQCKNPLYR